MTTEQLKQGRELTNKISDLQSRIEAAKLIRDGEVEVNSCSLTIDAYLTDPVTQRKYVKSNSFGSEDRVSDEMKLKIVEEINDCSSRIVRIFEKEIKRLEKEFENL